MPLLIIPLATQRKYQKPNHILSVLAPEGQGVAPVYHQIAHEAMLVVALGDVVNSTHM